MALFYIVINFPFLTISNICDLKFNDYAKISEILKLNFIHESISL